LIDVLSQRPLFGALHTRTLHINNHNMADDWDSIVLVKGETKRLAEMAPKKTLSKITVGLGWYGQHACLCCRKHMVMRRLIFSVHRDPRETGGADYDLDAGLIMLNSSNKLSNNEHFVYFGNKQSPCKSVQHTGDNLTGEGEGDDEQILVDLQKIPSHVVKLVIVVAIWQADSRRQSFGNVDNSYVRLLDGHVSKTTKTGEICR
jgi:stress response protein SCP2